MLVVELLSLRTLLIVLVLSIVVNVFLFYRLFNTAISLDYSRSEQAVLKKRTSDALAIINDMSTGMPKEHVLSFASALSKRDVIVKEQPSEVQVGDIVFSLKNEKVSSVDYIK